jgi:prepilin-type processing-associated H-X9-DG protein/prepilin-type N-terminal cleavage/methylation domain-containing protein
MTPQPLSPLDESRPPVASRARDVRPDVRRRAAFTLTELLVVMGLLAMLLTLLLPVVSKARAASHSAKCLANLREMGNAWSMYIYGSRGSLPPYYWYPKSVGDIEWNSHWISILNSHGVRGDSILCPSAAEISTDSNRRGFGSATTSWTGKYGTNGTPIRFTSTNYRDGSYGFNRHMISASGWGEDGQATKLTAVQDTGNVPLFFDCIYVDAQPQNHPIGGDGPAEPPPDLLGTKVMPGAPQEQWFFLLSRHGRGINMAMADGSARWVRLEDTYMLKWRHKWECYAIPLPSR